MRYLDKEFLIYDSELEISGGKYSLQTLEALGSTSEVGLKVHQPTGLVLPYFKNKKVIGDRSISIPDFISNLIKTEMPYENLKNNLIGMLKQRGVTDVTEETLRAIYNMPFEAKSSRTAPATKDILQYAEEVSAIRELNTRIVVDDVDYPNPNETYIRNSESDKVGFRLLNSEVIFNHELNTEYDSTPAASTIPSYPSMVYITTSIKDILSAPETKRKDQIKMAIKKLVNDYEYKISDSEANKLIRDFRPMPLDHVIGSADNDALPIQDNEQQFYENLIAFIKYHIHRFNREILVGKTDEEIAAKSEQDYASGNLPMRLQEYLHRILYDILKASYYHTGNFNYLNGDFDIEDESGNDTEVDVGLVITKEDRNKSDLDIFVLDYVKASSERLGSSVWAEAIIKLMRFGEQKPLNLIVGENNTQSLDMTHLKSITAELTNLSAFEVDKDDKGRSSDAIAVSFIDFENPETGSPHSYPFVLVVNREGTIPNIDDKVNEITTTTLYDVVEAYEEGHGDIMDISFNGSRFEADYPLEPLEEIEASSLVGRKSQVTDKLLDFAIDNGIQLMKGTSFSVINIDDVAEFKDSTPLLERLANTPKVLRMLTIQGALNSVFNYGASDYNNTDPIELLNWYYQNVYQIHKHKMAEVLGLGEPNKPNVVTLEATNFFGIDEEIKDENNSMEGQFMYNVYEGTLPQMHKIIKSTKDNTVIGGFVALKGVGYLVAHISEVQGFPVSAQEVPYQTLAPSLVGAMLSADPGSSIKSTTQLASDKTIEKIYNELH